MGTPGVIVRGLTGLKRGPGGTILRFNSAGSASCCCDVTLCGPSLGIDTNTWGDCLDPVRPSLSSINIVIVVHASFTEKEPSGVTRATWQADCSINLSLSFGTWNGASNAPWTLTAASAFFFASAFYSSVYPSSGSHTLSKTYPGLAAFLAEDGLRRGITGTPMEQFSLPGLRNASGATNLNWRYGRPNGAASNAAAFSCHSFSFWPVAASDYQWFLGNDVLFAGSLFRPEASIQCGRTFDYAFPSGSVNVSGHHAHAYSGLGNFSYEQHETITYASSGIVNRQTDMTMTQAITYTNC